MGSPRASSTAFKVILPPLRFSTNPPWGPMNDRTRPLLRRRKKICSRNAGETPSTRAMCLTDTGLSLSLPARYRSARIPYSPFAVSFMTYSCGHSDL